MRLAHSSQAGQVAVVDVAEGWSVVAFVYLWEGGDGKTYGGVSRPATDPLG